MITESPAIAAKQARESLLKSSAMPPRTEVLEASIPEEMKREKRWVLWKWCLVKGKWEKCPFQLSGPKAKSNDATTWSTFEDAFQKYQSDQRYAGIGFMLGDGWSGVDFDECYDPETAEITLEVEAVLHRLASYSEISPSGVGLKTVVRGDKPDGPCKRKEDNFQIECYGSGRFFTTTGWIWQETPRTVADGSDALDWIQAEYLAQKSNGKPPAQKPPAKNPPWENVAAENIEAALSAMKLVPVNANENDGSSRLLRYARQCVRWGLDESESVQAIRMMLAMRPTPADWTDKEILNRIGQTDAKHGEAIEPEPFDLGDDGPPEPETPYVPFPSEYLPDVLRELVQEHASTLMCDQAYIALPALATVAAAVGNSVWVEMPNGKTLPPAIWAAAVGVSGAGKSSGYKLVQEATKRRTSLWLEIYKDGLEEHKAEVERHEQAVKAWRKDGCVGNMPLEPLPHILQQCVSSDPTVEALVPLLQENPRGMLVAREELNALFAGMNQYKGGKGGDDSFFTESFDGSAHINHRAGRGTEPVYIPRALLSITGTIQPGILRDAFNQKNRASGLAPRFLVADPPKEMEVWSTRKADPVYMRRLHALLDDLYDLEPNGDEPHFVELDGEAGNLWESYFNELKREAHTMSDDESPIVNKILNYTSRFALLFHIVHQVEKSQPPTAAHIDGKTLNQAIGLARWFMEESLRIFATLDDDEPTRRIDGLVEWIRKWMAKHNADGITAREFQQGHRRIKTSRQAELELAEIKQAGYGEWDTSHRKRIVFRLK